MTNPFKNLGHYFATAISKFLTVEPKIEAAAAKVEAAAPEIEAVSAAVPVYGPAAVTLEKAGEMILGAVISVLHVSGAAAQANLENAGLDITAIQTAADVYKNLPAAIVTQVSGVKI